MLYHTTLLVKWVLEWIVVIGLLLVLADDLKPGGIFPDKMYCELHLGDTGKHFQEANPLAMLAMGPFAMSGVNVKEILSENVCWHNSILAGLLKGDPIPPKSLFDKAAQKGSLLGQGGVDRLWSESWGIIRTAFKKG